MLLGIVVSWFLAAAFGIGLANQGYYPVSLLQDEFQGPVDFSCLNNPLKASDQLFVKEGRFFKVGQDLRPNTPDDERVRLFGVNMTFGANFPAEEDAVRVAKRLRRLGVNLVRFHHLDTRPNADIQDLESILTKGAYPTFNTLSLRSLKRFIDALKAEGIYIDINLHVGYQFRPSIDKIPAMPDGVEFPRHSKPLQIFYPRMIELQKVFAKGLLDSLELSHDSVVAAIEINNESSLIDAWQKGKLESLVQGEYKRELIRQWIDYQKTNKSEVIDSLIHVGDKVDNSRKEEFIMFLVSLDKAYLTQLKQVIHKAVNPLTPVGGTQMNYGGLLNFDSHADMGFQDRHLYVDHYNFPHDRWDWQDWTILNFSSVGSNLIGMLNAAASRQGGVPFCVTEYNQPWPNMQGAEIVPLMASFAAFQDWDAVVYFDYSSSRDWDAKIPRGFDLNGDWSKLANFGQAAWLFRAGVIDTAKTTIGIPVSKELRLKSAEERMNGRIAHYLNKVFSYRPELALRHRIELLVDSQEKMPQFQLDQITNRHISDTGQIVLDSDRKILTVQADKAAGIFGFVPSKQRVAAGDVTFRFTESKDRFISL
ncbi:MAG: hypothetical protein Q8M92_01945, partial [Candidatus Subteraquimicrobiales bacterium]|nr:hypothetical protein [Candidatus Subteraquimicrobiales bacterium]